ncbi:MAG TPA: sigma-70 family RNA polymerase sigma factor [Planctomycetaceae bacterium]|nr:sigma-70 family RNA polymerase sigma factor [Planctomycetaceae bacterium]HIQ20065.1 sigma-70 family RNA polymerase sigma factor [Planctomycetota bacterium]
MALSEIDRNLLDRCLEDKPRAWEDFVDRFMGLVIHVINHSARARGIRLTPEDRDDLCSEVFLNLIKDDFAILRHFRRKSSLATYLTVVARRIVVRSLMRHRERQPVADTGATEGVLDPAGSVEEALGDREEVERLLDGLEGQEAQAVRMFHLQSKSYREIGAALGVPENSVGPILSRAREKMRRMRMVAHDSA